MKNIPLPKGELRFSFSRSSGPGGQKVNKSNTKVTLKWNVAFTSSITESQRQLLAKKLNNRINDEGDLVIQSDRFRNRTRNREDCLEKLYEMIQKALKKPKKRLSTKPTRSSIENRLKSKKEHANKKRDRRKVDY